MTAVIDEETSSVELAPVNDIVLQQLVRAAITEAMADEVTPPLTPGRSWTPNRVAWLRDYHHRCRTGLTGLAGEATWAVVVEQKVVGSVRLRNTDKNGVLDTGIWLTQNSRGRGIGRMAITAVLREAALLGANEVRADTTIGNTGAQGLLRRLSFDISATQNGDEVQALLRLDSESSIDQHR